MKVNPISQLTPFTSVKEVETKKKAEVTTQSNPAEKAPMPSAATLQAMAGVKPQKMGVAKPTPVAHSNYEASQALKDAGVLLSKRDYKKLLKS